MTAVRPNRIAELTRDALWIEAERSVRLGRGAEPVPDWMLNVAWAHLLATGWPTNRHLLADDGLNVKRSSAVCAVLAAPPTSWSGAADRSSCPGRRRRPRRR